MRLQAGNPLLLLLLSKEANAGARFRPQETRKLSGLIPPRGP